MNVRPRPKQILHSLFFNLKQNSTSVKPIFMKNFNPSLWILTLVWVAFSQNLHAQTKTLLINNVEIFNGSDEKTILGNILIEGNTISRISTSPIPTNKSTNVQIIDGKGKFLMPGLIDAHYNAMFSSLSQIALLTSNIGFVNLVAGKNAENLLMKRTKGS